MNTLPRNKKLKGFSQELRKEMTREEKQLWYNFLSRFPETVRRQYVIGNYIVDFVCLKCKIIIEVDGIQHTSPEMRAADTVRDNYLKNLGFTIMRFPNRVIWEYYPQVCNDILNTAGFTFYDLKPARNKNRRCPAKTE